VHAAVITTTNASVVKLRLRNQTAALSRTAPRTMGRDAPVLAECPYRSDELAAGITVERSDGTSASIPVRMSVAP